MGGLFTAATRASRIGCGAALLGFTLAGGGVGAAPPEGNGAPAFAATDVGSGPSPELPGLPAARGPALQLLWFDVAEGLTAPATEALAAEVQGIFRDLGVEVAFRVADSDTNYGGGPLPEIAIILLKDDPVVSRRVNRVMGLVVRHHEPNQAVWAFLENVRWTLGQGERDIPVAGHELALGRALGRVVAHEVIHAMAPSEPHSKNGLMGHSMNRNFLLGTNAPIDARCGRAFLDGLAARAARAPADAPAAALASVR